MKGVNIVRYTMNKLFLLAWTNAFCFHGRIQSVYYEFDANLHEVYPIIYYFFMLSMITIFSYI